MSVSKGTSKQEAGPTWRNGRQREVHEIRAITASAALLLAPGGFQIYLMARGGRPEHPSGGIGHEFLMWAVDSPEALYRFAQVLRDCSHYVDTHASGGVQFVEGHDPDGIRVVIAYPSPGQRPRSVLDPRFYN